ncbi:MAG TPA: hypothetical protein VGC87_08245 [Pyrinomonadaceae bacterium]
MIDRADARVLEMAGRVEQVRGAAATRLQEVGSIGALLRYRAMEWKMITIEEHIQGIVEANWGDKEALIYQIVHEMRLLRAALPTPAYLESVASQLEMTCVQEMDLPDGTSFHGPVFLRHAAQLVRLAMSEETNPENEATG